MNPFRPDILVALLAVVFCLEIGALFGVIYWAGRTRQEHLIFSLFNFSLAGMMACRLPMLANIGNRYLALRLFQWHCVFGCGAVVTFVHFTCLVTEHHVRRYLPPRLIYPLAMLMGALFFIPSMLHLAPIGAKPDAYTELEIGPLFPGYAMLALACGTMPCYLLLSTVRKLRDLSSTTPPSQGAATTDSAADGDRNELVLLRRHLALMFRGTLVLMAFILIDILWFLNPTSDSPLPFSAVGMIFLSITMTIVLGKDIVLSEKRKFHLEAVAQARLKSLSDAQHQLKNQIAAVSRPLMTARRGLERGVEKPFLETKLASAIQETEELQETLEIMLNVARVEAGKPLNLGKKASVDLAAWLEALCRKRAALEAASVVERYRIEAMLPVPRLFLNEVALKQVFYNLIDNAFKYSPGDSPICVQICVEERVQTLIVRICDRGKGLPLEDRERIFNEPFYRGTTDTRETPGTGLGLNLARRYVEAMEGRLWVESAGTGFGSTFVVTLPYEPDRSVQNQGETG